MFCPKCGKTMQVSGDPQYSVKDVKEEGNLYPKELIATLITLYCCKDCPTVKAVDTEAKTYVPKV